MSGGGGQRRRQRSAVETKKEAVEAQRQETGEGEMVVRPAKIRPAIL